MDQIPPLPVNPESDMAQPVCVRIAGHFGELVQGVLGPGGPVALITLPCRALLSEVRYRPAPGALRIAADPAHKVRLLAEELLHRWAPPGTGGQLTITRAMAPGAGAGSSTADLLGTIRALAQAFGQSPPPEAEAALCLGIEGAVDPLMYPGMVLFASRRADVIETLPPLPAFQVVGGFAGPGHVTDPADTAFPDMSAAFAMARRGMIEGDPVTIARAAHLSAEANQDRNPNPFWDDLCRIGKATGALGPIVSHTGSAIGLLFSPDQTVQSPMASLYEIGLTDVLTFRV